jgi:hypothetical protein
MTGGSMEPKPTIKTGSEKKLALKIRRLEKLETTLVRNNG